MILVDSNVIIDAANPHAPDHAWARARLLDLAPGEGVLNPVVASEVAAGMRRRAAFEIIIESMQLRLLPIDLDIAFRAGQAFHQWIASGGRRGALLPDLLIGAQAEVLGASILTRDIRRFRRYFPEVDLITPDFET
jgi:predicted nucleic acid-binding protein